jgi:hypothetical protein
VVRTKSMDTGLWAGGARLVAIVLVVTGLLAGAFPGAAIAGSDGDGASRDRPIPLGETGQLDDYDLTVISVTPDADEVVAAENQFNEAPAEGNQFFIARVEVTYTGSETGNPGFDLNLQAVGASNTGYTTFEDSCGTIPDGGYGVGELFEGGTVEYNACWQVASEDAESLVMYVEPLFSFDAEPVWFALSDAPAGEPATPAAASDDDIAFAEGGDDRDDPVALGDTARVDDYAITVLSVTPDANDVVAGENQFNDPPAEGNQFYIARVEVTYLGQGSGDPGFALNFQAVGDRNVGYTTFDDSCGVIPESGLDAGELFPGGSVEINVCWQVASEDVESLLMYVEPLFSFDAEPVWFALAD